MDLATITADGCLATTLLLQLSDTLLVSIGLRVERFVVLECVRRLRFDSQRSLIFLHFVIFVTIREGAR